MTDQDINLRIKTAIDAADTATSLSDLKKSIRELQGLALQYGESNTEAFNQVVAAAGRARDKITDVKQSVSSVSGEPIQNLSGAFNQVKSSLTSLDFGQVTNGIKLFTSNLNNLNPKELTSGFKGLGTTLLDLGKSLLTNPIFLIGAAIAGIIAGLYKLKDAGGAITGIFTQIGKVVGAVTDVFKKLGDAIGLTGFQQQKQFEQNLKNLDAEKKAIEDRYNLEISLANAAGKAVAYIEASKLFDQRKNTKDTIDQLQQIERANGKLSDEQKKQLEEAQGLYTSQTEGIKTYYNNLVGETNKAQKDFNNNSSQLYIDLIKDPVKKATEQADLDLKKGLDGIESSFKEQKARLESIRDAASDVYGDDYEKVRNQAVENLKQLDKDEADSKIALEKKRNESVTQINLQASLKAQQDLQKDLQDKAALVQSDQTREFSEKKQFLLDNYDAQIKASNGVYNTQIKLAQGNTEEIKRLENEKTNTVNKLTQDRTNVFITANNEQLQSEIDKQNKIASLEKNQQAAMLSVKQKSLDLQVETDNIELQRLQQHNSLKFGYEKELLDKIATERKAAAENDSLIQINTLKEQLRTKQISEQEYSDSVVNINKDTSNKINQIDNDTASSKKQINQEAISTIFGYAQAGANALTALDDLITQSENQNASKKEKASIEFQKKQFERHKALAIVSAIINTAQSVTTALATQVPPASYILAALSAVAGGIQIAAIASQKFNPSSSSSSSGSGASAPSAPSFGAAQTLNTTTTTATNAQTGKFYGIGTISPFSSIQQPPQRVYVVESDITNAQNKVQVIQQRATLSGR